MDQSEEGHPAITPVAHYSDLSHEARNLCTGTVSVYTDFEFLSKLDPKDKQFWQRTARYNRLGSRKHDSDYKDDPEKLEASYRERVKRLDIKYHKCKNPTCKFSFDFPNMLYYDEDLECIACHHPVDDVVEICKRNEHKMVAYKKELYNPYTKKKMDRDVEYCSTCGITDLAPLKRKKKSKNEYRERHGVVLDDDYKRLSRNGKKNYKGGDSSNESSEDDDDEVRFCSVCDRREVRDGSLFYCPYCTEEDVLSEEEESSEEESSDDSSSEEERRRKRRKLSKKKKKKDKHKKSKKDKKRKKRKSKELKHKSSSKSSRSPSISPKPEAE